MPAGHFERYDLHPFSKRPLPPPCSESLGDSGHWLWRGGLISEPLARLGGHVTGIDAGEKNIQAAHHHAHTMGFFESKTAPGSLTYETLTAEALSQRSKTFDVVVSLEVLEHVAHVPTFLKACKKLLAPGGLLILSTLNRTPQSFLGAIVAGEYILKWAEKGTHEWRKFIKPSELAAHLAPLNLKIRHLEGMAFQPLMGAWKKTERLGVNYCAAITHI